MAITEQRPVTAAPMPAHDPWRRWDRIAGRFLTFGWLCAAILLLSVGELDGSYAQLSNDLRAGEVHQVEVVGAAELEGMGWSGATIQWRDGLVMRTAEVAQASDERVARRAQRESTQPVVVGSVEAHLQRLDPDVRIVEGGSRARTFTFFGWGVPDGLGLLLLVLYLGTLGLIAGPRPWRATRWAWAWLVLLAPWAGIPAYLLLGGPLGLLGPRPNSRLWLTGGWAFLLALVFGGGAASR